MATTNSDKYGTGLSVITAGAHEAITVRCTATIADASGALTDGDIINLCIIPAGHQVVKLSLFAGDLDADVSPALAFSVGLKDSADAALDTVFIADSLLGQDGGTLAFPATTTMYTTAADSIDKILAIEVTTTAATKHAAERTIGCVATYTPQR